MAYWQVNAMAHSYAIGPHDEVLLWPESSDMSPDENGFVCLPNSLSPWMMGSPTTATSTYMPKYEQLFPVGPSAMRHNSMAETTISTASDLSSAPAIIPSDSPASFTDPWQVDDEAACPDATICHSIKWEPCLDDLWVFPKTDSGDDDPKLDKLTPDPASALLPTRALSARSKAKRLRGRPRKHALPPSHTSTKTSKGRSKTGCITCRKRKKKCDEAKPRCMNCEKNAVVCEGYAAKQVWKSGRDKVNQGRLGTQTTAPITMQPIFYGLETVEDMVFWKYYNERLSTVLTVEEEHKNAFTDLMVPLAIKHPGLMHSILSLSSKHIDYDTPEGAKILRSNPTTSVAALQQRSTFHHENAVRQLYSGEVERTNPQYPDILAAQYGQMACLLLESVVEGNPRGEHRVHLAAYQKMIQLSPPPDTAFLTFIAEFFQYHMLADELIRFPDRHSPHLAAAQWHPAVVIEHPRLLGVADGLLRHMSDITSLRSTIRANMLACADDVVTYRALCRAAEIEAAIRDWQPRWPPGDSRERVVLLYKQMAWLYLFGTIHPPSVLSTASFTVPPSSAVLTDQHNQASMTTPYASRCASCPPCTASDQHPGRPRPSLQNSLLPTSSPPTQPNIPLQHDARILAAANEALALIESIPPSDPSQTLLLLPCLILGVASVDSEQRERVRRAVRTVRGYTGFRNTDRLAELLAEVWRRIDEGDALGLWDWQAVASEMGVDCLIC